MSTPDAPGAPCPITPQDPPQFPCWLWCSNGFMCKDGKPGWIHPEEFQFNRAVYHSSHWHPEQPTAPEVRPETTNGHYTAPDAGHKIEGDVDFSVKVTLPHRPTPAETGAPTPETDAYVQNIHPAEFLKHPDREVQSLADFARRLERERDEANRLLAVPSYSQATIDAVVKERESLRHLLAAAEALLEKRTGALELTRKELRDALDCLVDRGVTDDETDGYKDGQSALDAAEAALALTPEQALAEKEGE